MNPLYYHSLLLHACCEVVCFFCPVLSRWTCGSTVYYRPGSLPTPLRSGSSKTIPTGAPRPPQRSWKRCQFVLSITIRVHTWTTACSGIARDQDSSAAASRLHRKGVTQVPRTRVGFFKAGTNGMAILVRMSGSGILRPKSRFPACECVQVELSPCRKHAVSCFVGFGEEAKNS